MATIHLIRHGEAAAHWTEAEDAALSALGNQQAAAVAALLASRNPVSIYASPLRRARETAMHLESAWNKAATIEAAIAEIPTQGAALAEKSSWLDALAKGGWPGADAHSRRWRKDVLDFVTRIESDAVIFTHFVVINVLVGAALERDDVYVFRPANTSITTIHSEGGRLRLIEQGAEVAL